ncbi:SNF2 family N-terminal domain-containing protein [Xylaria sp. FL0064]|nr:SNF2 family N-terminal domain-containing protein [Xylaria sp. FL0064]
MVTVLVSSCLQGSTRLQAPSSPKTSLILRWPQRTLVRMSITLNNCWRKTRYRHASTLVLSVYSLVICQLLWSLRYQDTGKYLGIVVILSLHGLLASYQLEVKAFVSKVKSDQPIPTLKRGKSKAEARSDYSLRIVVFGSREDKVSIGDFLSSSDIYLQHPLRTECSPGIKYFNPHYLVRAGGEMPKIEELSLTSDVEEADSVRMIDEVSRSRILRIFDHADGLEINWDVRPSPRLQTALMKHQLKALSFMIEQESGRLDSLTFPSLWFPDKARETKPRYRHTITGAVTDKPNIVGGGIIADEMGLGKTLSMVALICSHLDSTQPMGVEDRSPRTTLIVTPKSTLYGWQHIYSGQVNSLIYHGPGKHRFSSRFDRVDIVLTTYETLRSEHILEGPLYSQRWLRIVLDEAHRIRNGQSQSFAACCRIRAQHRWCLTGTPVQNSLDDYGALLSFLGVYPFHDKKQFDRWIVRPFQNSERNAIETLRRLVAATCLRRTKANCDLSTPLPQRSEEVEKVNLFQNDQEIYDFFKRKIQSIVMPNFQNSDASTNKRSKHVNILSIITLLRVVCDHVELLPQTAIDSWKREDTNMSDQETRFLLTSSNSEFAEDIEERRSQSPQRLMSEDTAMEGDLQTGTGDLTSKSPHGNHNESTNSYSTRSAKINALLKKLHLQPAGSKSVVFSSWTKMLDKVEHALVPNGFNYRRIDGQSSLRARAEAIRGFSEDSNCTVMLASICSAGEGVHRIGQTLPVTITRYIVPRSIETYIQWVQNDKLRLVNLSLDTIEDAAEIEEKRWELTKRILRRIWEGLQQQEHIDNMRLVSSNEYNDLFLVTTQFPI